ncbi:MAG TPA: glycosyltransferase family 4 protein [Terriglobia bacterium]|nr:glycosyltransferase family 4 protein [Terriglobia bacterium]
MVTSTLQPTDDASTERLPKPSQAARLAATPVEAALLTGGRDRHYAYGLAMSLATCGVRLEVVGGAGIDCPEMHTTQGLTFLNLRKYRQPGRRLPQKIAGLLAYYARLITYAASARPKIFHILWNNQVEWFDRMLLMLYYKALGKKIVVTVHNVNGARRERRDSLMNRLSLKMQYRLADHLFVHTGKMKDELVAEFGVAANSVTMIPYGINNAVPNASLDAAEAKHRMGISGFEKTILFFGNMRPSKGLEYLLAAFEQLHTEDPRYRLIVAGQPIRGYDEYWQRVQAVMRRLEERGSLTLRAEFIPDDDIALYFAAADVVALPYSDIFQSGVLFLAYSFGLPVVATDVGSLKEDIVEGRTGFVCMPRDTAGLAAAIKKYFESDLYRELDSRKQEIREYARRRHSWSEVAGITQAVYQKLSPMKSSESRQPQSA